MLHNNSFTIVDVETTGGSPWFCRIIDIGVLKIVKGELVETFETLLNPRVLIPEFITNITGIRNEDVADAPVFEDIKDRIIELCTGSIFVAHNVNFDYSFLQAEFGRVGYGFTCDKLCTVRLSRALYPEHKRHNLNEIIDRFKLSCDRRHRAFDDAQVLWNFLQLVSEQFSKADIDRAIGQTMRGLAPAAQKKRGGAQDLSYYPMHPE